MAALLLTILGPTVVFGAFALLAMRFGAESRPFFDERPVVDDRPNWFPIARSAAGDEDDEDDEPGGGEPVPAVAGAPERPRRARAVPVADAG